MNGSLSATNSARAPRRALRALLGPDAAAGDLARHDPDEQVVFAGGPRPQVAAFAEVPQLAISSQYRSAKTGQRRKAAGTFVTMPRVIPAGAPYTIRELAVPKFVYGFTEGNKYDGGMPALPAARQHAGRA